MKNCKDYIIYKFDNKTSMETPEKRAKKWKKAQEFTDFKVNLINNFADENFDDLCKRKFGSGFDIGMNMIEEKFDCKFECHWRHDYYAVPKIHKELIEFFENNIPDWVTKVSKI